MSDNNKPAQVAAPRAIRLIIKGGVEDAECALALHGVHPWDWLVRPKTASGSVCTVVVAAECEPGVARWFAEDSAGPTFPVGTLLHYTLSHEGG